MDRTHDESTAIFAAVMRTFRYAVVALAVVAVVAGGCGPRSAAQRAERADREREGEHRDPPCLPFADKKPAPSRGEACGDGIAGERCVEVTTHSCHASERGTRVQCEPNEICDGEDLRGQTCDSLGLGGKGLRCRADCNDFDSSACDACPKRAGVTCTDLPLAKGRIAQVIARAPSGAFAVIVVEDDGRTMAMTRAPSGVMKGSPFMKDDFQPRRVAVAGRDDFLIGGDRHKDTFVVAPLSFRGGLGAVVRIPIPDALRATSFRSELETSSVETAVIVVRDGPSSRVVGMIPVDAQGKRAALPSDEPLEDGKAARGSGTLDAGSCGRSRHRCATASAKRHGRKTARRTRSRARPSRRLPSTARRAIVQAMGRPPHGNGDRGQSLNRQPLMEAFSTASLHSKSFGQSLSSKQMNMHARPLALVDGAPQTNPSSQTPSVPAA